MAAPFRPRWRRHPRQNWVGTKVAVAPTTKSLVFESRRVTRNSLLRR